MSDLLGLLSKCPALKVVLLQTQDVASLVAIQRSAMAASTEVSRFAPQAIGAFGCSTLFSGAVNVLAEGDLDTNTERTRHMQAL